METTSEARRDKQSFFDQNDAQQNNTIKRKDLPAELMVQTRLHRFAGLLDYIKANLTTRRKIGHPPAHFSGYHVFLGARVVEHRIARWIGIRHAYIKIFENHSKYTLIESLPFFSNGKWCSGAWFKENQWELRGIEWELFTHDYEGLITELIQDTEIYHRAKIPYNYKGGPNSNSFIGWLLRNRGLDFSKFLSGFTFWGMDYWHNHPIHRYTGKPFVD